MRFRHLFMIGGSLLVLAVLFATDPDKGLTTGMLVLSLVTPVLAVAFAHWARKSFFDYPEADGRPLFKKAGEHPIGAGLALIAIAIVIYGLLGLFGSVARAQDVRTFIPAAAAQHRATFRDEVNKFWPDHPRREVLPALAELESCTTLTHSKCWSAKSRLKTSREEGAGIGQQTRAWYPDGRLRFDNVTELSKRHAELRELSWANIYSRPDLQIRALVLESRDNYRSLSMVSDPTVRLQFADAAYNGGLGGLQKERRACGLKAGCDPQKWFGHVELPALKSKKPLYGTRSPCDINRQHVWGVTVQRAPKYKGWLS